MKNKALYFNYFFTLYLAPNKKQFEFIKFSHPENILDILVTELVINKERSKLDKDLQSLNISDMEIILLVKNLVFAKSLVLKFI